MNSTLGISSEAQELRKNTPSQVISAYSPELQDMAIAAFPTVDRARDVYSPTLGVMSEAFPARMDDVSGAEIKDMAIVWMQSQLLTVSMFCGAKEKMNEWQSISLCKQIINEHPDLRLMEFILFCSRLRSFRYGKFYGSIDPAEILGSFNMFLVDRNRDLWEREEEDEKRRKAKEKAEHDKAAITFEEFIKMRAKSK